MDKHFKSYHVHVIAQNVVSDRPLFDETSVGINQRLQRLFVCEFQVKIRSGEFRTGGGAIRFPSVDSSTQSPSYFVYVTQLTITNCVMYTLCLSTE